MNYNTSKLMKILNDDLIDFKFKKCSSRQNVLQKGDNTYINNCLKKVNYL